MAEFFTAADVVSIQESLGQRLATYTPNGGSPVSVKVSFYPQGGAASTDAGEVFQLTDEVQFLRSEVDAPAKDAALVFDDADLPGSYLLGEVVERDDATVLMEVRKV